MLLDYHLLTPQHNFVTKCCGFYLFHFGQRNAAACQRKKEGRCCIFQQPQYICGGLWRYRKIPKISPRAYIFKGHFWGAYFWRGLCTEENLHLKIDWASHLLGRKFTVFLCFTLYLMEISKYKPPGGLVLILEGWFNGRFFALRVWGAYIWRDLYMERLIFGFLRIQGSTLVN